MDNNNGGKFLNGFILGVVIGVGATLLLSTKKGKKILRSISEEGLDGILERLDGKEILNEEDDYDEEVVEKAEEKAAPPKRFFRGIDRKISA